MRSFDTLIRSGWLWKLAVPGIALALLALALSWRPAIAPIAAPDPAAFPKAQVARGAALAKLGDCAVCHSAEGGAPLAGGRPLPTPFGTFYSTNLTPDGATGIGHWSAAAFRRAMRDGVRRDGAHLYPALPYEHFTHVADADLDALYAFLMTRRPVRQQAPANRLIPPLGFRPLLAGWKWLFLHRGAIAYRTDRSPEWNRGAYLVEGLGHCGGCHTPRNPAGAEIGSRALAGGSAEGWRAPPLDAANPAAAGWSADALYTYLRTGVAPDHGVAAGPMAPVVESLSQAPEADVRAIATYIAATMAGKPVAPPSAAARNAADEAARAFPRGATLFAGACAGCHGDGAPMLAQERPALAQVTSLRDLDPASALQAILQGIEPPVAGRGPKMPGFAASFTDAQIAEVAAYARARFTTEKPWPHLQSAARTARKQGQQP